MPCLVDLHTDSQYLRNGIIDLDQEMEANGWRTADKKPVKNVDLWQRLDEAIKRHQVRWHWVKGHAGHAMNERADQLARDAIVAIRAGAVGALDASHSFIPDGPQGRSGLRCNVTIGLGPRLDPG